MAFKSGQIMNGSGGRYVATGELSEREAAFVSYYVANRGNATDAAREAGYSTPHSEGWRLTRRPHVRAAIRGAAAGKAWALRLVAMAALERVLNDVGQPGDVAVRAVREAREFASELDAIAAKAAEAEAASGITDGSGRDELPPEYVNLMAALAATETATSQPTDNTT